MSKEMNDKFWELDEEEQELEDSLEPGEWKRVDNFDEEVARVRAAASATLDDMPLRISVAKDDLALLEVEAAEEGLAVPSLITEILHKYANGELVDKA